MLLECNERWWRRSQDSLEQIAFGRVHDSNIVSSPEGFLLTNQNRAMKYHIKEKEYEESCSLCNNFLKTGYFEFPDGSVSAISPHLRFVYLGDIKICCVCLDSIVKDYYCYDDIRHLSEEIRESETWRLNHRSKKPIGGNLRVAVFRRDNFKCLCCGTEENLHLDHIIPESKGGEAKLDNLQVLCKKCNSSKHTKIIDYRKK